MNTIQARTSQAGSKGENLSGSALEASFHEAALAAGKEDNWLEKVNAVYDRAKVARYERRLGLDALDYIGRTCALVHDRRSALGDH